MTIGPEFSTLEKVINRRRFHIQIWDYGGEERFRLLLPSYLRGSNAILITFSFDDIKSIENLEQWITFIKKELGEIPIFLVGTKSDKEYDDQEVNEKILEIQKKFLIYGLYETSAKTGEGVEQTFKNILLKITNLNGEL